MITLLLLWLQHLRVELSSGPGVTGGTWTASDAGVEHTLLLMIIQTETIAVTALLLLLL